MQIRLRLPQWIFIGTLAILVYRRLALYIPQTHAFGTPTPEYKLIMAFVITLTVLVSSLYVILSKNTLMPTRSGHMEPLERFSVSGWLNKFAPATLL